MLRPARALEEKATIGELALANDWLSEVHWSFAGDLRLSVSFTIHYAQTSAMLVMEYPAFFPDLPPQIKPASKQVLSGHQYGSGGELCLEWRTDNWHPDITGAMMIESAFRLLSGEAPVEGEQQTVPDAHHVSIGQEVRSSHFRLVLPPEVKAKLDTTSPGAIHSLHIAEHKRAGCWIAQVERIGAKDAAVLSANLPADWARRTGSCIRLPDGASIPSNLSELIDAVRTVDGDEKLITDIEAGSNEHPVLLNNGAKIEMRTAASWSGERKVISYKTIAAPPFQHRLIEHKSLASAKVGIVGCGSVGSKVAISLARTGVANFVLVDGDLFFDENLVRNGLDCRASGLHKTDALEAAIKEVSPVAVVAKCNVGLGAQTSSTFMETAIAALEVCDILIDATGDAAGFNILGGIAQRSKTPMLFAEVYGGGIGGLVCRLRPEHEPTPRAARDQIEAWCKAKGVAAPMPNETSYASNDEEGAPLIADDSAVSAIAAHLTAMAVDVLEESDDSRFPFPAYMVGLAEGWIFSTPFETFPIELHSEGAWGPTKEDGGKDAVTSFVKEVVSDMTNHRGEAK